MNIYIKMVKNKNKKPPARINFEKKKDDKLRFFFKSPRCVYDFYIRVLAKIEAHRQNLILHTF